MPDIRKEALQDPVDVTDYLFTRLRQLGVKSIHGVPGDYNLVALDYIPKNELTWVGSTNELNAGTLVPRLHCRFGHDTAVGSPSVFSADLSQPKQPTPRTVMPGSTGCRPS
jgi:hypothetical protein